MGWLMNLLGFGNVAETVSTAFDYNRENFQYDRKQRLEMEFQVIDMRLSQTALWRQDVRDILGLTGRKIEVYLTIVAFELTFAVCALCKARCPHGSPPWLIHCHTLSLMSAFMYLFLSVWLGMHAFVAAQAYKVRILTQLVRLPIPTARQLEGMRTYLSQFERNSAGQMLRVPFATGRQGQHVGGTVSSGQGASDPWGLERNGENLPELASDVNDETEKQRHIWLVREAAMFYQTYDAFCRICLSAGTSSLATFFSYFCISYVLTENAAVTGAFCGTVVFVTISLVIFRLDLLISTRHFITGGVLLYLGPLLTAVVAFWNSRQRGDPGRLEWLMPVALIVNGIWPLYYLWLFRVQETLGGQLLPLAFRTVLYIDVFGWAKHAGNWWRRLPSRGHIIRRNAASGSAPMESQVPGLQPALGAVRRSRSRPTLASTECMTARAPVRPEDPSVAGSGPLAGPSVSRATSGFAAPSERSVDAERGTSFRMAESLRPDSFVPRSDLDCEDGLLRTGSGTRGQKPGQLPWQIFALTTQFLAICWWFAAGIEVMEIHGYSGLVNPTYGLRPGAVAPAAALLQGGERVVTSWPSELTRPLGLACNHAGATFVTSGYTPDGHKGLLLGHLSEDSDMNPARLSTTAPLLRFSAAPVCLGAEGPIQDLDIRECQDGLSCNALVLTQSSSRVIDCQLHEDMTPDVETPTLPLSQAWLQEGLASRVPGAAPMVQSRENVSSVTLVPCPNGGGKCLVLGTTRHRLVHMEVGEVQGDEVDSASESSWIPRHVLEEHHSEASAPGTLTAVGSSNVAVLHRGSGKLHLLDINQGGSLVGVWQLPSTSSPHGASDGHTTTMPESWASICAGSESLYALEAGDSPHLWRFPLQRNGLAAVSEM
eukprot:CAMPEP_0178391890 /NCGR_PEP_ID=MMETSP0689_2-20121128/11396_1 /TAXON_ID=160604 /ORGANISM="Amphidinium massartii, Strain CS-259" /LENGTH=882 /DNA_ID=CAMNT_0020012447 /DNA_START=104 /DNA_END=2752 /DNA_ORIENTATION=+